MVPNWEGEMVYEGQYLYVHAEYTLVKEGRYSVVDELSMEAYDGNYNPLEIDAGLFDKVANIIDEELNNDR